MGSRSELSFMWQKCIVLTVALNRGSLVLSKLQPLLVWKRYKNKIKNFATVHKWTTFHFFGAMNSMYT